MNKQLLPTELIQYILKIKTFTRNQRIHKIHQSLHSQIVPIDIQEFLFGHSRQRVYFFRKRGSEYIFEDLGNETVMKVILKRKGRHLYLPSVYINQSLYIKSFKVKWTQAYGPCQLPFVVL